MEVYEAFLLVLVLNENQTPPRQFILGIYMYVYAGKNQIGGSFSPGRTKGVMLWVAQCRPQSVFGIARSDHS